MEFRSSLEFRLKCVCVHITDDSVLVIVEEARWGLKHFETARVISSPVLVLTQMQLRFIHSFSGTTGLISAAVNEPMCVILFF